MTALDPAEHVSHHASAAPLRPALRFPEGVVTYGELDAAVDAAADGTYERGALVRIGITSDLGGIAKLLAVHRAGSVPLPVPGDATAEPLGEAPDAAVVVSTSGSGGAARAVPLTAGNLAAATEASALRLGTGGDDVWLLCLPLHHVAGLSVLWRTFAAGGSALVLDRFDAGRAAAALRGDVTVASFVPTMARRVLDVGGRFVGVRAVLVGGGAVPDDLIVAGAEAGLPLLATYGMTETASQVATVAPGETAASLGTVGRPLPGMEVTVAADGELLVDGPAVFAGYVGDRRRVGPHRTGDVGSFDAEGRLIVSGRLDDMIVTGGENVHPAHVESVLESHPAVSAAVVFGVPSEEWGREVSAVVAGEVSSAELHRWVRGRLAPHEVPKRLAVERSLPMLPSGKVDRSAVQESWRSP